MTELIEQIERIKRKLVQARSVGQPMRARLWRMNQPLALGDVTTFEVQHGISLPEDYRLFVTRIGVGDGPFAGIESFIPKTPVAASSRAYLGSPCLIFPGMSKRQWRELNANQTACSEDVRQAHDRVFGGLLYLGSQGCSLWHGLVLNGEFAGRVVNLDSEGRHPFFAWEKNFLDWYERWVDEAISGELDGDRGVYFGYAMGGSAEQLIACCQSAQDDWQRAGSLAGLLGKETLDARILDAVEATIPGASDRVFGPAVQVLTKFRYQRATQYLNQFAQRDFSAFCECLLWYGKQWCADWLNVVADHMGGIDDVETFQLCVDVLRHAAGSYAALIVPFTESPDAAMRAQAFLALGEAKDRGEHVEVLLRGLEDPSDPVISCALTACQGIRDERLRTAFIWLAQRNSRPWLKALDKRLKEFGLSAQISTTR